MKRGLLVLGALLVAFGAEADLLPDHYGVYLFWPDQYGGSLLELDRYRVGFRGGMVGIEEFSSWRSTSQPEFIYYGRLNPESLVLSRLEWVKSVTYRDYLGHKRWLKVGLWVPAEDFPLRIRPVEGRQDMYRLTPTSPLPFPAFSFTYYFYALHTGELGEDLGSRQRLSDAHAWVFGLKRPGKPKAAERPKPFRRHRPRPSPPPRPIKEFSLREFGTGIAVSSVILFGLPIYDLTQNNPPGWRKGLDYLGIGLGSLVVIGSVAQLDEEINRSRGLIEPRMFASVFLTTERIFKHDQEEYSLPPRGLAISLRPSDARLMDLAIDAFGYLGWSETWRGERVWVSNLMFLVGPRFYLRHPHNRTGFFLASEIGFNWKRSQVGETWDINQRELTGNSFGLIGTIGAGATVMYNQSFGVEVGFWRTKELVSGDKFKYQQVTIGLVYSEPVD